MTDFISEQLEHFRSLRDTTVVQVSVTEMALIENTAEGMPIFRHEAAPFIQTVKIELVLSDGRFAIFDNHQNDYTFPIGINFAEESQTKKQWPAFTPDGEPSIYRLAPDIDIPLDKIENVKVIIDDRGDIEEISLNIGDRTIVLKAGEVIEDWGDTFVVKRLGGSILLFTEPDDIRRVHFDEKISWR